jgi:transposase InsO family protein
VDDPENRCRIVTRLRYGENSGELSAWRAIFAWISYYNRTRLHSTLGYLAPLEWERRYSQRHPVSGEQAA